MVSIVGEKREKTVVDSSGGSPQPQPLPSQGGGGDRGGESDGREAGSETPRAPPVAPLAPPAASSAASYTDFSSVPEPCTPEDALQINADSASSPEHREMNEETICRRGGGKGDSARGGGKDSNNRRGACTHATFPAKLHDILSRPDLDDVVSWLPHGRGWRIVDQSQFVDRVMPHFFTQSKFASFMRQVNGWGFVRVTRGDEVNSYYSEFFLRGRRSLVRFMERKPAARDVLGPEPNFAQYEDLPPNPEVDVAKLIPLPSVSPSGGADGSGGMAGDKRRRRATNGKDKSPTPTDGVMGGGGHVNATEDASAPTAQLSAPFGGSGATVAVLNIAGAFPPVAAAGHFFEQQQNLAGQQPLRPQQFLNHQLPPQNVPPQQPSQQWSHLAQQQQQQAAAYPSMQLAFSHQEMPTTMMPSGAMLATVSTNAQQGGGPVGPNQGFHPQQLGGPVALANQFSPSAAPLQQQQQQYGANNFPCQGQQQQLQHAQFNAPQDLVQLAALMQSGQLSPIQQQALMLQQQNAQQRQMQQDQQMQMQLQQQQNDHQQQVQQNQQMQINMQLMQQQNTHQFQIQQNTQQFQIQQNQQMQLAQPELANQRALPSGGPNSPGSKQPTQVVLDPNGRPLPLQQQQQCYNSPRSEDLLQVKPPPRTAAAGLPPPSPLELSPPLYQGAPVAVPKAVLLPGPALQQRGVAGGGTDGFGTSFDGNGSAVASAGLGLGLKSAADDDPVGAFFDKLQAHNGAGGALGAFDAGGNNDTGGGGSDDGVMEMEDVDVTGMIPVTAMDEGEGAFGGSLGEEGLVNGSLDDIW